jgi:hypothetical protein
MPNVIDKQGIVVFSGRSDAECVRWWRREGHETDRLEDTNELMVYLDIDLGLD